MSVVISNLIILASLLYPSVLILFSPLDLHHMVTMAKLGNQAILSKSNSMACMERHTRLTRMGSMGGPNRLIRG